MKITTKGQVTIPLPYREAFGLFPHTDVDFIVVNGMLCLAKPDEASSRGVDLVRKMSGRCKGRLSTDEIMRMTRGDDA